MAKTSIADVPEELLLYIFNYCDSPAPSELKSRQEPTLDLTSSNEAPSLKNISRTSKLWRRIALPLLFRSARLRLDQALTTNWTCPSCPGGRGRQRHDLTGLTDAQVHHFTMAEDAASRFTTIWSPSTPDELVMSDPTEQSTMLWALTFYHQIRCFLDFVEHHKLESAIRSFVLLTERLLAEKLQDHRFPHEAGKDDWRYLGAAALWKLLFSTIDPKRVAILAPPLDLACLANAAMDTFGDWAFSDMDYHLLEVRRDNSSVASVSRDAVSYADLKPLPRRHPGIAGSSVLHARPWTHIAINEGSFLKAFGTYEYFERGPPSIVYSLHSALTPPKSSGSVKARLPLLPSIRSYTYTAIFPFATHIEFRDILPSIDELDCQFAPDKYSGILDDKARVGRAMLQDCWQELFSSYENLSIRLATRYGNAQHLKKFVCRDSHIDGIRRELDDIFIHMSLPRWVEATPGVFTSTGDTGIHRPGTDS